MSELLPRTGTLSLSTAGQDFIEICEHGHMGNAEFDRRIVLVRRVREITDAEAQARAHFLLSCLDRQDEVLAFLVELQTIDKVVTRAEAGRTAQQGATDV